MVQPFISADELHEFDPIIRQGWETVQAFYEPAPITTQRRDDDTGEWSDVATFTPYRIRLSATVGIPATGVPIGASEIRHTGDMRVDAMLDVQRDDAFMWEGNSCRVTVVPEDDNHGTRVVDFVVREG